MAMIFLYCREAFNHYYNDFIPFSDSSEDVYLEWHTANCSLHKQKGRFQIEYSILYRLPSEMTIY